MKHNIMKAPKKSPLKKIINYFWSLIGSTFISYSGLNLDLPSGQHER